MQQKILEHYGIYPKNYDPSSQTNLVLNIYDKTDLKKMKDEIE